MPLDRTVPDDVLPRTIASLQLIGLQLWMPLFFIIMFCLCYVAAFHTVDTRQLRVNSRQRSRPLMLCCSSPRSTTVPYPEP